LSTFNQPTHPAPALDSQHPARCRPQCSPADRSAPSPSRPSQSINYNHLLPTRYALELEGLKGSVAPETFKEVSHREDSKKAIKKLFEERYLAGKNRWFFTPLRF